MCTEFNEPNYPRVVATLVGIAGLLITTGFVISLLF